MTSTDVRRVACLLLLAAAAFGLASHARAQATTREVDLAVHVGGTFRGYVVRSKDGFQTAPAARDGRAEFYNNFKEDADWVKVSGWSLGHDPAGKDRRVQARSKPAASLRWRKAGTRRRGMSFQVAGGPLEGWYIGLGPPGEREGGHAPRPLVLVKDEKDSAVFTWDDPKDCGK